MSLVANKEAKTMAKQVGVALHVLPEATRAAILLLVINSYNADTMVLIDYVMGGKERCYLYPRLYEMWRLSEEREARRMMANSKGLNPGSWGKRCYSASAIDGVVWYGAHLRITKMNLGVQPSLKGGRLVMYRCEGCQHSIKWEKLLMNRRANSEHTFTINTSIMYKINNSEISDLCDSCVRVEERKQASRDEMMQRVRDHILEEMEQNDRWYALHGEHGEHTGSNESGSVVFKPLAIQLNEVIEEMQVQ